MRLIISALIMMMMMTTMTMARMSTAHVGCKPVNREYAHGALLGVFVGDAAGATLEFSDVSISESMALQAMRMPGGGIHGVGPGQVTDDSELTIALARALKGHDPYHGFPTEAVAKQYRAWYASSPFDVGSTCATAFSGGGTMEGMRAMSAQRNQHSESNGALMRVVPLAIWMATRPAILVADAAREDALLSHPNVICQDANAAYAVAVAHLLTHPGDVDGALVAAVDSSNMTSSTVKHWLIEDSALEYHQLASLLDCTHMEGHVRYAFTLAFHFLRHRTAFEDAILQTLQKGGDTDTNAAIVGGLLGALHGAEAIPPFMKDAVLKYDCSSKLGRVRPFMFSPGQINELMDIIHTSYQCATLRDDEL